MKAFIAAAGLACVAFVSTRADAAENCDKSYASTFELIRNEIFDQHGCSNDLCHGSTASGGLDLRGAGAFDQLIDARTVSVPEETHPGLRRVVPGRKAEFAVASRRTHWPVSASVPETPASEWATRASSARWDRRPQGSTVYDEVPLKGVVVWNSHAFNLNDHTPSNELG